MPRSVPSLRIPGRLRPEEAGRADSDTSMAGTIPIERPGIVVTHDIHQKSVRLTT